jgi:hypothetical protein
MAVIYLLSFKVGTGVVVGKTILLGLAGNCKFLHFSSFSRLSQYTSLIASFESIAKIKNITSTH